MIYGYLRVSTDDQDSNSQKQGVDSFAEQKGWTIDKYITDEGVSGGKDPSKRKLGPMLSALQSGDIVICSEISRLGRDLYMVMDILHFCMEREVVIYTVKDNFVLGDSIQSKVLAFAFGLSAEIERQMIRQRTKEGLKLRMKKGVLLGRPIGAPTNVKKLDPYKDEIIYQYNLGVPQRRLAQNFNTDRNTLGRALERWGVLKGTKYTEANIRHRKSLEMMKYKDDAFKIVTLDRGKMLELIRKDLVLPDIAREFPEFTYEQIYDTVLCDREFNQEYHDHGHQIAKNS
jgi:DNA invertase Pin-like site-specific DNA recombinase